MNARSLVAPAWLLASVVFLSANTSAETWMDDFSVVGPVGDRYEPAWEDIPTGVGRYYAPEDGYKQRTSLIRDYFTEGVIEVQTAAIEPAYLNEDFPEFGGTGLVIKSRDDEFIRLRIGPYGQIQIQGHVAGKPFEIQDIPFELAFEKVYRLKAELREGHLKCWVDGELKIDAPCPISTEPGRTGLFCESRCWFDNYRVTGTVPPPDRDPPLTGTPVLETVHARFRAEHPDPVEIISPQGTIEFYLRNTGDGPAELASIDLFGKPIDFTTRKGPVVWYEQRPWRIAPGDLGQVIIRMRGLPQGMGELVMADPAAQPLYRFSMHWKGGVSRDLNVPFTGRPEPFQINLLTFGPNLRTLHIYLQNNDPGERNLDRVLVNGQDVTAHAVFGVPVLRDRIVPLRVDLPDPLPDGREVTVLVTSKSGGQAGHCLRAIPSRTLLQVCVFSQWTGKEVVVGPRADWIEDMANHCVNAVSVVGKYFDHLPRLKEMGIWAGGFGSFVNGYGGWGRSWDKPGNSEIVACWMDEVDKRTPFELFEAYQAMRREERERGKQPPFHSSNLMIAHNSGANNFLEIADGVIHGYGWAENYGRDFGRYQGMAHREFRRARRPFLPYLRNAEIYPHVDPETRVVSVMDEPWLRCMSPEEERWQYYGLLLQGAKGVQHWGYSSARDKTGYGGDSFRLGLGGAGTGRIWHYEIDPKIVEMLQAVWDEVGRCNAEWRAIEHLIAVSDVSDHARVTQCEPALNHEGRPAAAASSLLAGLDAIVVVALNHHLEKRSQSSIEPSTFHPVEATIEIAVPAWLQPVDVFRVSHDGLSDVACEGDGNVLRYAKTLHINDLVVITGRDGMKDVVARKLAAMQENLQRAYTSRPVHTDAPSPYEEGEVF